MTYASSSSSRVKLNIYESRYLRLRLTVSMSRVMSPAIALAILETMREEDKGISRFGSFALRAAARVCVRTRGVYDPACVCARTCAR